MASRTEPAASAAKPSGWDGNLDPSAARTETAAAPARAEVDLAPQLSHEQINQAVSAHRAEIMECVKRQRAEAAGQSGTLTLQWVIEPNGETSHVVNLSPELGSAPIASCLIDLVHGWSFPRHSQPQESIAFPFKF